MLQFILFLGCLNLTAPENGFLDCEKTNGTKNCTIRCEQGLEFTGYVDPYYSCGPESDYKWNHQTEGNRKGHFPACEGKMSAREQPPKISNLHSSAPKIPPVN